MFWKASSRAKRALGGCQPSVPALLKGRIGTANISLDSGKEEEQVNSTPETQLCLKALLIDKEITNTHGPVVYSQAFNTFLPLQWGI